MPNRLILIIPLVVRNMTTRCVCGAVRKLAKYLPEGSIIIIARKSVVDTALDGDTISFF